MCVSTQSKFYTVISNIMANYKRLPCGRDYESVGQEIIQKYPFMKNDISKKVSYICSLTYQLSPIKTLHFRNHLMLIL